MKTTKMFLLAIIGSVFMVSTSCEKEDYSKLENTVWEAQTDESIYILKFVDKSTCSISVVFKEPLPVDMIICVPGTRTYSWRYGSEIDSTWGLFHIYSFDTGEHPYSGTVENKKLYLNYMDDIGTLCFERK